MIRALLVDDEERVLNAVKENVNWKMCRIDHLLTADDPDIAMSLFEKYRPEIVLTDIEMPGETGLELVEKMRRESQNTKYLCITCHPEFAYMRKAMQLRIDDYILKPIDYEELENVLRKLTQEIIQKRNQDYKKMNEDSCVDANFHYYEDDKLVELVRGYIADHLLENINIGVLAEHLSCSQSRLMRIFKKKNGLTIMEYLTRERMKKAKRLLEDTDLPISTIASFAGYEDYSYFTRVFKKESGITPREYRELSKPVF